MKAIIKNRGGISGCVEVPGDKSISHRALIIGSIADGSSLIKNFLNSGDCLSTAACLRALGVEISFCGDNSLRIKGSGGRFSKPSDVLDCGNSGTTMRLMAGLLASRPLNCVLTGDESLRRRPMRRIIEPLSLMGACISAGVDNTYPPITISGRQLNCIDYRLPVASAQVKSCIILASLFSSGTSSIEEPMPSRDHTERMLRYLGGGIKKINNRIYVGGGQSLKAKEISIPGDFSSAAYLLAAAAILPGSSVVIKNLGLNPTRTGLLDVMAKMGANLRIYDMQEISGETVGQVRVEGMEALSPVDLGSREMPVLIDEVPLIAVMACFAKGRTSIEGAGELRVKESDRIKAIVSELSKMGAEIHETPDGLQVEGGRRLKGAHVDSWNDHRIAMALSVAALGAEGETVVNDFGCVSISFPGFSDLMASVGADLSTDREPL